MSVTINTQPQRIDKSAAFGVVTSLVEDSTHVNLRLRADIYHEGIIKAVVEKPKGLDSFDFADILKSLTPGLLFARDSGDIVKTGSVGSNLITGWSVNAGSWDTFTSSTNQITSAIEASAAAVSLKSNDITMTVGELYVVYSLDLVNTGGNDPNINNSVTEHAAWDLSYANIAAVIIPITTGTRQIVISAPAGDVNFSGTFICYKITTNRTTIGNPLAPYFVKFTEVYEDAAGVTTTGGTALSQVLRFVPAYGDGIAFTEYVLHDNTSLFACKTFKNNISKIYSATPYEYLIVFFTEYVELELFYSKDGAGAVHTTHPVCYEGWGVVIVNVGELLATVTATLAMYLKEIGAAVTISETLTVNVDSSAIDERVVLEFDGLTGGKEYLAFEGLKDIEFSTVREYYSTSKKNRKPIRFTGINRQKIETRFKDMANAEYLKSLLISDNVKKLLPSYASPTDVTILTDSVTIDKGREFFTNRLDIEYEY
jgi:hypothetical protein